MKSCTISTSSSDPNVIMRDTRAAHTHSASLSRRALACVRAHLPHVEPTTTFRATNRQNLHRRLASCRSQKHALTLMSCLKDVDGRSGTVPKLAECLNGSRRARGCACMAVKTAGAGAGATAPAASGGGVGASTTVAGGGKARGLWLTAPAVAASLWIPCRCILFARGPMDRVVGSGIVGILIFPGTAHALAG